MYLCQVKSHHIGQIARDPYQEFWTSIYVHIRERNNSQIQVIRPPVVKFFQFSCYIPLPWEPSLVLRRHKSEGTAFLWSISLKWLTKILNQGRADLGSPWSGFSMHTPNSASMPSSGGALKYMNRIRKIPWIHEILINIPNFPVKSCRYTLKSTQWQ